MKRRVKVHLHGSLRKIHPGPITVSASTAYEATELVTSQLPGFQPTAQGYKHIRLEGFLTEGSLREDLTVDELHIYPQLNGGKNGGFVQILVAAAMMAVLFVVAGPAGIAASVSAVVAGTAGFGQVLVASLFMMSVSTAIGGLTALLFPQPTMNPGNNQEASKYLGVPSSTTKIGTTIRVIYGLRRVGFHYLSFNTNARSYKPPA